MSEKGIGQRVTRVEDKRFVTGRGRYTDDVNVARQAFAVFVRSPLAHAKIVNVDTSAALDAPGVIGVLTGADVAADGVGGLICGWMVKSKDGSDMKAGAHPILAHETVRYVGDHVAVVVASSYSEAKDAAELVEVEYDELPAIIDLATAQSAAAMHDGIARNTVYEWELGDKAATEAALAGAAHVTEVEITNNRLVPNAMEPRAAIGQYDPATEQHTLYTTSQNPHVARLVISAFVGLAPEHKLRVVAPDVGGGFGSKIFIYAEECVCLWAAKRLNVPVK